MFVAHPRAEEINSVVHPSMVNSSFEGSQAKMFAACYVTAEITVASVGSIRLRLTLLKAFAPSGERMLQLS